MVSQCASNPAYGPLPVTVVFPPVLLSRSLSKLNGYVNITQSLYCSLGGLEVTFVLLLKGLLNGDYEWLCQCFMWKLNTTLLCKYPVKGVWINSFLWHSHINITNSFIS